MRHYIKRKCNHLLDFNDYLLAKQKPVIFQQWDLNMSYAIVSDWTSLESKSRISIQYYPVKSPTPQLRLNIHRSELRACPCSASHARQVKSTETSEVFVFPKVEKVLNEELVWRLYLSFPLVVVFRRISHPKTQPRTHTCVHTNWPKGIYFTQCFISSLEQHRPELEGRRLRGLLLKTFYFSHSSWPRQILPDSRCRLKKQEEEKR